MKNLGVAGSAATILALCLFGSGCHSLGWHRMCAHTRGEAPAEIKQIRCFVCSGRGFKRDANSGKMEMCGYCNGTGLR